MGLIDEAKQQGHPKHDPTNALEDIGEEAIVGFVVPAGVVINDNTEHHQAGADNCAGHHPSRAVVEVDPARPAAGNEQVVHPDAICAVTKQEHREDDVANSLALWDVIGLSGLFHVDQRLY